MKDEAGNSLASDFNFDFFVLAADANRDRVVNVADLGVLATNWQQEPRTFSQGDFSYDGKVDVEDLGILATNWQKSLPPPVTTTSAVTAVAQLTPGATSRTDRAEVIDQITEL